MKKNRGGREGDGRASALCVPGKARIAGVCEVPRSSAIFPGASPLQNAAAANLIYRWIRKAARYRKKIIK